MTGADHILAGLLAGLSLLLIFFRPPAPQDARRMDLYLSGAFSGLVFGAAPLVFWAMSGRPLEGFGLAGWQASAPDVGAGLLWAALLAAGVAAAARGKLPAALDRLYSHYAWLMPRTRAELGVSWGTSAAAGVGEEIAYRGFLLWYGAALLGPLPGLLLSSLLFGAAHGYQRRLGMAFATSAGLVLGAAYLATGSLPLVMWMHATYNMASFTTGWLMLGGGGGKSADASL